MTTTLNAQQRRAILWAKARLGDSGWDNLCLAFVRQAFGVYYTPEANWPADKRMAGYAWDKATRKHHETDPNKIPRGVPVFFELKTEADHVALSLGDGWCISNDFVVDGRIDRVKIADIAHKWGPLLGWTEDLVGNMVADVPEKVEPKSSLLTLQLSPMQFSDPDKAKHADVRSIFAVSSAAGVDIMGGTESGGSRAHPLQELLPQYAEEHGYYFHLGLSTWVAFRKASVKRGTWHKGTIPVIKKGQGHGTHSDRGIAWGQAEFPNIGRVTAGVGHKLIDGRKPGQPNYKLNLKYDEAAGDFARRYGNGRDLAFYMADQNMNDAKNDTFHGQPLLSIQDELKEWIKTHKVGPIDVIASFDHDGRVEAEKCEVFTDARWPLHIDHFVSRAKYRVHHLKGN